MRKSILAALLSGCAIGGVPLGADILSNQPGRDYQVGRTLTTIPRKAVTEINRVVGFSTDTVAIQTSVSGSGNFFFKQSFTVNKAAYPYDIAKNASVTIASESTIASGANNGGIIYINGRVDSYDMASGLLVINVPRYGNGWGGPPGTIVKPGDITGGGAGGICQFNTSGPQYNASNLPSFKGDGVPRSDWSLTLNIPPNFYQHYRGNFMQVADPMLSGTNPDYSPAEGLSTYNWDFSGVACALIGLGAAFMNGNPVIVSQCKFEQANRQIGSRGQVTFLNMGNVTNARFVNCDMPWNWRKWSIQVTVTADTAVGQTVIPISGSLLENPGFLLPNETPNLVKPYNSGSYRYRVVNENNPQSLTTCYISDCTDNTSITLAGLSNPTGKLLLPPIAQTVKKGEVLTIYPEPTMTNFIAGNVGLVDLCYMDNLQDLYNPANILNRTTDGNGGFLPVNNVITRSIINDIGSVNGHDDICQLYNWNGYMEMSFLKINFGWRPGDEAFAAAIRCNNPREMCIWGNNLGWNGETSVHDIMMVTIGGVAPYTLGSYQRIGGSYMLGVKGVYPGPGANLTRVSFAGPFNGGTITAGQELWTLSGTNTALDGNFKAQNTLTLGGGNGILNASMLSQFGVAAASQGATSLTVTSGSVAAMGKGCVIATAGSSASGPNQVIGVVDSISGSTINLLGTTGIPAALTAGAAVYCYPWIDMAGTATVPKQGKDVQVTSATPGQPQITVPDTSIYSVGMGVQGYDAGGNANQQADIYNSPFVPDNTFVLSIDSPTKMTLTRNVLPTAQGAPANWVGKWITVAPFLRGNKTGASYFYNLFVGNKDTGLATEFAYRAGQGYEAFFDAVSGGIAAWNVFDFNHTPLPFYISDPSHFDVGNGFTGFTGPVFSVSNIGQEGYNKPLTTAPPNVKLTSLGGGQLKIEFDAVAGAKGYTYTLDGMKFQLDPTNNQAASNGTIISGAVIFGLSGVYSVGVASLIGANDIGVPVIRGPVSPLQSVSVAA